MTIHFADVSNWQQGMSLAGMPAVIAKATEGTGYTDPFYAGYQQQARTMGVPFVGYHYLHHGSIEAQAQLAFSVIGAGTPCMLDVEVVGSNVADSPEWPDVQTFTQAYRARGGRVTLAYIPEWYWRDWWGSPDMTWLERAGLALISSDYTAYSDTGPGWRPYGGVAPAIWQYTSTATVNGRAKVDMNAFRGSIAELAALFNGSTVEDDMEQGERVTGFRARGNTVGDVLADLGNFRDWLYAPPGEDGHNPPPDGSRAQALFSASQTGGVDVTALAAALAGNTDFVKAIAKAVNDDAAARLAE